jgi:phosphinothricin acetyltransferase
MRHQGHREPALRSALPEDAEQLAEIYSHYVTTTFVTFEEKEVTASEMARRIAEVQAAFPWLVAAEGARLLGYAFASPWKARSAYRFSTEVTVYVREGSAGSGIGSLLYGALIPALQSRGLHMAMGGIALPNDASIRLHEKFGFAKAAHFKEVGFKFGRWIDVGYWQRAL